MIIAVWGSTVPPNHLKNLNLMFSPNPTEMSKDSPTHGGSSMREVHSISDGIVEVFGVVSSFHIAQLQVGLSRPVRLGQARRVRIRLHGTLPVQADGEPWMQAPCDINIGHCGQATMLRNVVSQWAEGWGYDEAKGKYLPVKTNHHDIQLNRTHESLVSLTEEYIVTL